MVYQALIAAFLALASFGTVASTPLDDYVWAPDSAYGWVEAAPSYYYKSPVPGRGWTAYYLNMTSQRWLTDADFSESSDCKSLWWHWLLVIVPDELKFKNNGSMWITGSGRSMTPPDPMSEDVFLSATLAVTTGTVTGVLFDIPNEHITFASDPIQKSRSEDAIIAFTWDHFLDDTSNPNWLVRFPMVKASVRAMDAMQEFTKSKLTNSGIDLQTFTITGASKRGWTTWLVGAVDPARVKLIVPIVLDAINFVAVEHHEFRSYGGWSYALQDYVDMNLTMRFDEPNMLTLQQMEDPYFYRDRLTMPKLVVNAVMDEFQQPDDTHYWWADMPEPKHFMILPNAEHSLATGILEAVPAIGAWILNHLTNDKIPQFDWTIDQNTGAITATVNSLTPEVHSATLWWAYSCGANAWDNGTYRRDYRVAHLDNPCNCGLYAMGYCANLKAMWAKKELQPTSTDKLGRKTYTAQVDAPGDGRWVAFFIDFKFHNKNAVPFDIAKAYQTMKPNKDWSTGVRYTDKFPTNSDNWGGFPHDFGRFFEFTTEVSVWPNVFPYADCNGADCGTRVL